MSSKQNSNQRTQQRGQRRGPSGGGTPRPQSSHGSYGGQSSGSGDNRGGTNRPQPVTGTGGGQTGGSGDKRGGSGSNFNRGSYGERSRPHFEARTGDASRAHSSGDYQYRSGPSYEHRRDDSRRGSESGGYHGGPGRGSDRGRGGQRGGRFRPDSPVRFDVRTIAKTADIKPEYMGKDRGIDSEEVVGLITNHYKLIPINKKAKISAFQYDIEIKRRKDENKSGKPEYMLFTKENYDNSKRIVEKMAEEWTQQNGQRVLQRKTYGYDGNKILYSVNKLVVDSEEVIEELREVKIRLDGFQRTYDVKIQFSRKVPIDSLNNLETTEQFIEGHPILDIAMRDRDLSNQSLVSFGRHLFNLNDKKEIKGTNCWIVYGNHQSINLSECGLIVNIDRVVSVFRVVRDEPLIDFLCRELQISLENLKTFQFSRNIIENINHKIKGLNIYTKHIIKDGVPQKRTDVIHSMFHLKPNEHSFEDNSSGNMINLEEYFHNTYGIEFGFGNIPLIKIKSGTRDNPKLFPAELCFLSPQKMSREMIGDNPDIQSAIVESTNRQSPLKRFERIHTSVQTIIDESKELMNNFGYRIEPEPIKLDGRELPVPKFEYKPDNRRENDYVLYEPIPLNNSIFLNLSPRVKPKLNDYFKTFFTGGYNGMIESAKRIGMTVSVPVIWNQLYDYDLGSITDQIQAFKSFMNTFNEKRVNSKSGSQFEKTQLIFVSLPHINDVYNTVKYYSENRNENNSRVITQCIDESSFINIPNGYFFNFLRKTNAKLNGRNQVLSSCRPDVFTQRMTMVVGADVTHAGSSRSYDPAKTSIAGVVASYDSDFTKYVSRASAQLPNVEIIRDFDLIIGKLINHFKSVNEVFPEIIVLFRDGVSESQLQTVMSAEVELINKAYRTLEVGFEPEIFVFVVQKRHHMRFLLTEPEVNPRTQKENYNPKSGTLVIHTITNPFLDEFILYSQKGILGTSRPAKYIVLQNDIGLTPEEYQKFAYSMCFTDHRCSTPISIPIPVKYADDSAYRARRHLKAHIRDEGINGVQQQNADLEDVLIEIDRTIEVNNDIEDLPYYL